VLLEVDGASCFDELALQAVVAAANAEVPMLYFVTLPAAGVLEKEALLKCGAHLLAALCLSQAIRSSTPIVLGVKGGEKGTIPEFFVQVSALNAMMKEFGIPFGVSILSDAAQEGNLWALEMSFSLELASLIGVPLISGLTSFRSGSASSPTTFPIVNEVYDFVSHSIKTHRFDEQTFALDTIHETIARGSSEFLSSQHTVDCFRSIMWKTDLMDKRGYEPWEAAGRPNLRANAQQKAQQILSSVADKQVPREFIEAVKSLK
jgi:trimethylamine:corrinoid methyltransferase-like protein